MSSTNLTIAAVFAAVFGVMLIWLLLYLLHRYIHQQCQELDHWIHSVLSNHISFSPCEHGKERSRSRSARRDRSRGRSGYGHPRRRDCSRDIERYAGRNGDREWMGMVPVIPINMPVQPQPWAPQPCYPSLGWQTQAPMAGPTTFPQPMAYPQLPVQAAQVPPYTMSVAMPQQPLPQMATATPGPAHQPRQQPYSEASSAVSQELQPERQTPKPKPSAKPARRHNEVDYIQICDEYPPIVLEGLKKSAPPPPPPSETASDVSGTTEEIPRESIPRAKLHFADESPMRSPQLQHSAPRRGWNAPIFTPRQWMNKD